MVKDTQTIWSFYGGWRLKGWYINWFCSKTTKERPFFQDNKKRFFIHKS